MAGAVETVGIEARVENIGRFLSDLAKGEASMNKFLGVIAKGEASTSGAGKSTDALSGSLSAMGAALAPVTGGVSILATAVGQVLADAFGSVTGKINEAFNALVQFGWNALEIAGRVDELQRSALLLAQRAGYTRQETEGFLAGLEDLGIRADVAAGLITNLSRFNVDLAKSTDLASVAQNAAVIAGIDSSDALEKLTHAAVTNQMEVARSAGILVNFTKAQDEFAQAMGKTREQLTEAERTQANFNAIINEGAKIAGVYKTAMDSPTKALRSLGREIFNLQAALGAPFLDAFAGVVGIMRDLVQQITAAVSEGGALYPVLVNLGAAASLMVDGLSAGMSYLVGALTGVQDEIFAVLSNIANSALDFGVQLVTSFVSGFLASAIDVYNAVYALASNILDTFGSAAAQAFSYGAEMVVQLAEGIISAASQVLVAAMNYIGSILSWWLAPGSPPRVAPEMDQWGTDAMAAYLKGFTEADFGVLGKLESAFEQALGDKGLKGVMDDLLTAVNMGMVTDEIFSSIAASAGELGNELALLARYQISLADATERAARADQDLSAAQSNVSRLVREYNQMLREGAAQDELDAKMAQISAAQGAADAAKQEQKAAKTGLDQLEERAKLQDELVKQLVKFGKLQEAGAGGGGGGGGGGIGGLGGGLGGGIGGLDIPGMPEGGFDIGTRIGEAIEQAKQHLLAMFTGDNSPFAPLITAWNADIVPRLETMKLTLFGGTDEMGNSVEGLIPRFQMFATEVGLAWDEATLAFDTAKMNITTKLIEIDTAWQTFKDNLGIAAQGAGESLGVLDEKLMFIWNTAMSLIMPMFNVMSAYIMGPLSIAWTIISNIITSLVLPAFQMIWDFVMGSIMPLFAALGQLMFTVLAKAGQIVAAVWSNILWPALQKVFFMARNVWMIAEEKVIPIFNDLAALIRTVVGPAIKNFSNTILTPMRKVFSDIAAAVQNVITKIKNLASDIANLTVPDWLEPGSPPPLYYALKDIGTAMDELSSAKVPRFAQAMAFDGGGRSMAAGASTHQVTTIAPQLTIGPNTFNNGLDLALVEAIAENVLRRSLGGA